MPCDAALASATRHHRYGAATTDDDDIVYAAGGKPRVTLSIQGDRMRVTVGKIP